MIFFTLQFRFSFTPIHIFSLILNIFNKEFNAFSSAFFFMNWLSYCFPFFFILQNILIFNRSRLIKESKYRNSYSQNLNLVNFWTSICKRAFTSLAPCKVVNSSLHIEVRKITKLRFCEQNKKKRNKYFKCIEHIKFYSRFSFFFNLPIQFFTILHRDFNINFDWTDE